MLLANRAASQVRHSNGWKSGYWEFQKSPATAGLEEQSGQGRQRKNSLISDIGPRSRRGGNNLTLSNCVQLDLFCRVALVCPSRLLPDFMIIFFRVFLRLSLRLFFVSGYAVGVLQCLTAELDRGERSLRWQGQRKPTGVDTRTARVF